MSNLLCKCVVILGLQITFIGSLFASEFTVSLEIPRLDVAEYHRPYLAMWIAEKNNHVAANLSVLYDIKMQDGEGQKWLKDLRQWWRRSGRSLEIPVDGVTGATKVQGQHDFEFSDKVSELPPGEYRLILEVVREVGGREKVEIPFEWPAQETLELTASGEKELGNITLHIAP